MADRLNPDQTLAPDQGITSNNRRASLIMQNDGNLVLYEAIQGGRRPLWSSDTWNTPGAPVSRAVMQGDGNLVVYTPGNQPIWASNTSGNPGAYLLGEAANIGCSNWEGKPCGRVSSLPFV